MCAYILNEESKCMAEQQEFNQQDVEILEAEIAYNGYFKILRYSLKHRLFAGGWSEVYQREVFAREDAVGVLLYDPIADQVVLIKQFRAGAIKDQNPWLLETVAGIIEAGESDEQVAIRETREEAGVEITEILPIYRYYTSPGGSSEQLQLYCAKVDSSRVGGIFGLDAENEDIQVSSIDRNLAYAQIAAGKIVSGPCIIALQWLQLNYQQLPEHWY